MYENIEAVFIDFLYVFGSNLMLVWLQNHTKNQYFFVVWFWYGFGLVLVWSQTKTIPNGYVYLRTNVRNEYDGIIRYFFQILLGTDYQGKLVYSKS